MILGCYRYMNAIGLLNNENSKLDLPLKNGAFGNHVLFPYSGENRAFLFSEPHCPFQPPDDFQPYER